MSGGVIMRELSPGEYEDTEIVEMLKKFLTKLKLKPAEITNHFNETCLEGYEFFAKLCLGEEKQLDFSKLQNVRRMIYEIVIILIDNSKVKKTTIKDKKSENTTPKDDQNETPEEEPNNTAVYNFLKIKQTRTHITKFVKDVSAYYNKSYKGYA